MEGEEEGDTLELEMGLRGDREIDGSEMNPCLIIVDTSLADAIREGERERRGLKWRKNQEGWE